MAEDGEGLRGKQGLRKEGRLAPANNPLLQHARLHIAKLKRRARKKKGRGARVLQRIKPPLCVFKPGPDITLCDQAQGEKWAG